MNKAEETAELIRLKRRNHSLRMQSRNLQRQIKSLERDARLRKDLLAVAFNNCEGPQREAETYKEVLFRTLSRLADDGSVPGKADPRFLIPEIMEKASELKATIMRVSKIKCHYDKK